MDFNFKYELGQRVYVISKGEAGIIEKIQISKGANEEVVEYNVEAREGRLIGWYEQKYLALVYQVKCVETGVCCEGSNRRLWAGKDPSTGFMVAMDPGRGNKVISSPYADDTYLEFVL